MSEKEQELKNIDGIKEKDPVNKAKAKKEKDRPVVENKSADASESLLKKLKITIPRKEISKRFDQAAEKYSSEMKLDGFRKGKIPVEVVKSKYHEIITDEVINKMIEEYTFKKIKEENIPIISSPVIEDFDFKDGEDLVASVTVDLFPEVVIPDIEKIELKIKKDLFKTDEFDEAKQIEMILDNNKRKQIIKDRKLGEGDFVEFKIQSQFADNKRMMPKKEMFFTMKNEPHDDIGDIYNDLLDKVAGDKIEIKRKYKNDYKKKNWAGKTIIHFIEVKNIYEYKKPDLNEEFLKAAGFPDEKSFKLKLKEEYSLQQERQRDQVITGEIRDKMLELCDFSVPESIIEQEVQRSQSQYAQIIMTLPKEQREEYMKTVRDNADRSIKFSFILEEVKKKFDIKVENEDLEKEFKSIAEANGIDVKEVRKYYMNKEQNETLRDSMGRNLAIDLLKEKISIKEV